MYLTLWTLRVSPLYLSSLHSVFVTRTRLYVIYLVLDSMFVVTLCLSSIIIYVLRV